MLVFDLTDKDSFDHLPGWLDQIHHRYSSDKTAVILVGNKCDLEHKKVITTEQAQRFAESSGLSYIETSARTNTNITQAFELIHPTVKADIPGSKIIATITTLENKLDAKFRRWSDEAGINPKAIKNQIIFLNNLKQKFSSNISYSISGVRRKVVDSFHACEDSALMFDGSDSNGLAFRLSSSDSNTLKFLSKHTHYAADNLRNIVKSDSIKYKPNESSVIEQKNAEDEQPVPSYSQTKVSVKFSHTTAHDPVSQPVRFSDQHNDKSTDLYTKKSKPARKNSF